MEALKDKINAMCVQLMPLHNARGMTSSIMSASCSIPALNYVAMALQQITDVLVTQVTSPVVTAQLGLRANRGPRAQTMLDGIQLELERKSIEALIGEKYPPRDQVTVDYRKDLLRGLVSSSEPANDVLDVWPTDQVLLNLLGNWSNLKPSKYTRSWLHNYQEDRNDETRPHGWFGTAIVRMEPEPHSNGLQDPFVLKVRIEYDSGSWVSSRLVFRYHPSNRQPLHVEWDNTHDENWSMLRSTRNQIGSTSFVTIEGSGSVFDSSTTVYNAYENLLYPGDTNYMPYSLIDPSLVAFFKTNGYDPLSQAADPLIEVRHAYSEFLRVEAAQGGWPLTRRERMRSKERSELDDRKIDLPTILQAFEHLKSDYRADVFLHRAYYDAEGKEGEGSVGSFYTLRYDTLRQLADSDYTIGISVDRKRGEAKVHIWSHRKSSWVGATPRTLRTIFNLWVQARAAHIVQQTERVAAEERGDEDY